MKSFIYFVDESVDQFSLYLIIMSNLVNLYLEINCVECNTIQIY